MSAIFFLIGAANVFCAISSFGDLITNGGAAVVCFVGAFLLKK